MNTSRRGFFAKLAAAAVGLAVDPELIAWEPGKRTFFDLYRPRQLGISIRMLREYDVVKDLYPRKIDMLYGWSEFRSPVVFVDPLDATLGMLNEPMPSEILMARQLAASEGFVLTETMPRAEFERRWREV